MAQVKDLLVNGSARVVGTIYGKMGGTLTVGSKTYNGLNNTTISASDLGLSNAMHFIGVATVAITDGSTTDPGISGYSIKTAGDVIIDKDTSYEYVWTTAGKWERLGPDGSYKTVQSAVSSPAASGNTTAFIDTISQNANGVITVTKKNLDTSGTWSGNAATATSANRAQLLRNYFVDTSGDVGSASRPTDANISPTGSGGLITFKATSSMTANKPPVDAHIIHMFWDNKGGYDAQIALGYNRQLYLRGENTDLSWKSWVRVPHTNNTTGNVGSATQPVYVSNGVITALTGALANNITGNAATATKLATARTLTIGSTGKTFDGSANVSWTLAEIGAQPAGSYAAASHSHSYLPLSGGTMTGNISFKTTNYTSTPMAIYDDGTTYGHTIVLEGGGTTYIGAGEAASALRGALNVNGTENLYLTADTEIYAYTNCQSVADRKGVKLDTGANFLPVNNNLQSLGSSSARWKELNAQSINTVLTGGTAVAAVNNSGTYVPAKWTFDAGITPVKGTTIIIEIPGVGHDYGVFLSTNNGTNYYPVSVSNTGRVTTHYSAGQMLMLVFDSDASTADMFALAGATARSTITNGAWRVINYYDSGNSGLYQQYTAKAYKVGATALTAYDLVGEDVNGLLVPAHKQPFLVGGPLYITDGARSANTTYSWNGMYHTHYNMILRNSGTNINGTAYKPVYLKGTISGSIFTPDATTPYVFALPTTDDSKYYLYVGETTASTNSSAYTYVNISQGFHPIFVYKDSGIKTYSGYSEYSAKAGSAATATTLATARTINGTSFNGSANITTTNWGTARTLTIGSTGKSVNGSANVSWTLAEIGAQPAGSYASSSHVHTSLKSNTDNRSTNTTPNDYNSVFDVKGLKTNSSIGISGHGSYSGVWGMRGWSDSSGGNSHEFALCGDGILLHRHGATTTWNGWTQIWESGQSITGAVWNDYAEYREADTIQGGRCVREVGDDTLSLTTSRLMRGCSITSDTWGFAQGETDKAKTPIAVAGRVLAYPLEDREEFRKYIGYSVCSGPNGTVSLMTEEEELKYPWAIVGTVSAVPDYEEWGGGEMADRPSVKVDGRVWIKIK